VVEQQPGRASRTVLAVAVAALAVAGLAVGLDRPALAVDAADIVGSPGGAGEDATCRADRPTEPIACNVVGEDGADGETGADLR
jgi:hypothetical protein